MNTQHYTASFTVDQSPQAVFDAINNVRGWWSQAEEGDTDKLGAVFYHHYQDVHRCTLKITEFVPGEKVVWRVLHNDFNFIKDRRHLRYHEERRQDRGPLHARRAGACL
jgi:hypothetical protein